MMRYFVESHEGFALSRALHARYLSPRYDTSRNSHMFFCYGDPHRAVPLRAAPHVDQGLVVIEMHDIVVLCACNYFSLILLIRYHGNLELPCLAE